jgi:retinol-binding protein 3
MQLEGDNMYLSKPERDTILQTIVQLIQQQYVLPRVGERVSDILADTLTQNSDDDLSDPYIFMRTINQVLADHSADEHLRLLYDPTGAQGINHEVVLEQHFVRARRSNFGFLEARRLEGNIGYLNIQELPPREVAGDIAAGMLATIAHTGAVILDLRGNEGGTPGMVQFLVSYFVDEQPRPLSGIYSRVTDSTKELYTLAEVPGRRLTNVPLYVLVSGATFSAGEALAYDLQALKRATIIGEATRGGAHLSDMLPIANTYILRLPTARAINPITADNWEGRGVQPDIECAAMDALTIAHRTALNALLQNAQSESDKAFYQWELETFEARRNPPTVDMAQWQSYAGRYCDWHITAHADHLSAQHHTCYRLLPVSQNTFMVEDEVRLQFAPNELRVVYRDGGAEHLARTTR